MIELRFSPYAWAKVVFMCTKTDTEVGMMGVSRNGDPLVIDDILVPKQTANSAYNNFDMDSYSDETAALAVDHGVKPACCQRVWIHTHPAGVDGPSGTDEVTFRESYGKDRCDWAVMMIMTKAGKVYARMRASIAGVDREFMINTRVDWSLPLKGFDPDGWSKELAERVSQHVMTVPTAWGQWVNCETLPYRPSIAATTVSLLRDGGGSTGQQPPCKPLLMPGVAERKPSRVQTFYHPGNDLVNRCDNRCVDLLLKVKQAKQHLHGLSESARLTAPLPPVTSADMEWLGRYKNELGGVGIKVSSVSNAGVIEFSWPAIDNEAVGQHKILFGNSLMLCAAGVHQYAMPFTDEQLAGLKICEDNTVNVNRSIRYGQRVVLADGGKVEPIAYLWRTQDGTFIWVTESELAELFGQLGLDEIGLPMAYLPLADGPSPESLDFNHEEPSVVSEVTRDEIIQYAKAIFAGAGPIEPEYYKLIINELVSVHGDSAVGVLEGFVYDPTTRQVKYEHGLTK